tara:strand:+ start:24868 stop:25764 length:897 start_codon:yes stop_codon:yes gene_type:complete
MNSIGIIGQGFVGTAIREGMKHAFEIICYDKINPNLVYSWGDDLPAGSWESDDPIGKLLELVDGPIFVCVPTPMKKNGAADTSIVESVVKQIVASTLLYASTKAGPIVIKSTVPPGTTERLMKETGVGIIFNPEFLTEAASVDDFKNQDRIIIGGPRPWSNVVKNMYQKAFPHVPTVKTSATTAEMVKYVTNTFLATKVAYANEISQICNLLDDVDYDKVIEYATKDARLGNSHWSVPGPDGRFGFGGSCFPKDLNALIAACEDLEGDCPILKAIWAKNLEVRPERDWEDLKGRAVVE